MVGIDSLKPLDLHDLINFYPSASSNTKISIQFEINQFIKRLFKTKIVVHDLSPLKKYIDTSLYTTTTNPIACYIENEYCKIARNINLLLDIPPDLKSSLHKCINSESYDQKTFRDIDNYLSTIVSSVFSINKPLINTMTDILIFKLRSMIFFESIDSDNDGIVNHWSSFEFILLSITSKIQNYNDLTHDDYYNLGILIYMYHKLIQGDNIEYEQKLFFEGLKNDHNATDIDDIVSIFYRLMETKPTLYEAASYITDNSVSSLLTKDSAFMDLVKNELTDIMAEEHGKVIIFGDNFINNFSDVHSILRQMDDSRIWKNLGVPVSLNLTEDDLGFLKSNYLKDELRIARIMKHDSEKGLIIRDIGYHEDKIYMLFARRGSIKEIYGLQYTSVPGAPRELIKFEDSSRSETEYKFKYDI